MYLRRGSPWTPVKRVTRLPGGIVPLLTQQTKLPVFSHLFSTRMATTSNHTLNPATPKAVADAFRILIDIIEKENGGPKPR